MFAFKFKLCPCTKVEKTQKSHAVLGDSDWLGMRDALLPLAWHFALLSGLGGGGGGGGDGVGGAASAPPRTVLVQAGSYSYADSPLSLATRSLTVY
jgi:hypothetical protein